MNAERLVRLVLRLLMRHGMKRLARGQKPDSRMQGATRRLKTMRRIGRL